MDRATFDRFRRLIYEQSGITLAPGKHSLVRGRLSKRMRQLGMEDGREYLEHVLEDSSGEELVQVLNAISTNFTSFFREPEHFRILSALLQRQLRSGKPPRVRIWSAACSSGEEPYSIAMTMLETAALVGVASGDMRILATDISTRILQSAEEGIYSATDSETIPGLLRQRYCERAGERRDSHYRMTDEVRRTITFRRLNLARPPFPMEGPFDVIFCRNVMIYFDNRIRTGLLREAERLLRPGGLLFVGHTESLAGLRTELETVKPSVFRKRAQA